MILERLGCDRDYWLRGKEEISYLYDRHIQRKERMNREDAKDTKKEKRRIRHFPSRSSRLRGSLKTT